MSASSMHVVVGLCGNDSTTTRGLGQPYFPRGHDVLDEVFARADRHLAGVGTRRSTGPRCGSDSSGSAPSAASPGLQQHPHQVAEAFLRADRLDDLEVGVELDVERGAGRGR